MKSEEIMAEIAELKKQSNAIMGKIRAKNSEYLAASIDESPYKIGEMVRLYSKYKGYIGDGIFAGLYLKYGNVICRVFKIKKDGSASKKEWQNYDFDRIESAHSNEQ